MKVFFIVIMMALCMSCINIKYDQYSSVRYFLREELKKHLLIIDERIEMKEYEKAHEEIFYASNYENLSDFEKYHLLAKSAYAYHVEGDLVSAGLNYLSASRLENIPIPERKLAYDYQARLFFKSQSYAMASGAVDELIELEFMPSTELLVLAVDSHLKVLPNQGLVECKGIKKYLSILKDRVDREKYIPEKKWRKIIYVCGVYISRK